MLRDKRYRRYGISLGVAATLALASMPQARAGTDAEERSASPPRPGPLRLDDSPSLVLLAPFRYAAGPPASFLVRWREGPCGRWRFRPWWTYQPQRSPLSVWLEGAFPEASLAHGRSVEQASTDARLDVVVLGPRPGWPAVPPSRHVLQPWPPTDSAGQPTSMAPTRLSIDPELVPRWLQALDGDWAQAAIASSGCGRGGDCSPQVGFPARAFEKLWAALAPPERPIPAWQCRPRKVRIMGHGREHDAFRLVRCDGSVPPGAVDRLSLLARPVGVEHPGELPELPDPGGRMGEWVAGIRLVNPRLLWALQSIADEFPYRGIYIYSGYRPAPDPPPAGTRNSQHWLGRAADIAVHGVPNEELFKFCRTLPDVGCGYYPNKPFVHVDVRTRGHGKVFWIDISAPGERSQYVDSWPGVVEGGAISWSARASR